MPWIQNPLLHEIFARHGNGAQSPLESMTRFTLLILAFLICGAARAADSRPNFVFVLADDLRWNALGCAGDKIVQTPHIDALARRGVIFRQQFVTTSICNVSRASILTGQSARRHGIVTFADPLSAAQWRESYPAKLRSAGYHTGFIGKFGVGDAKAIAAMETEFDFWRGLPNQAGLFFEKNDPARTHKTARFGNQALEFIQGRDAAKPFCLSISFNAPHARDGQPREFAPDPRDEALYAGVMLPVPRKASEEWFLKLPEFVRESEGHRRWALRFDTPERTQATLRDYYRLVSGLDREVGRIVALLEERGLVGNTVFVFTSDNGFFFGERGLADKWLMYEESIRVPLIIVDPRLPEARRGSAVDAMTLNIDLAPTLLELAGVEASPETQGRSLAPLLRGERPADWRTEFFYEHHTLPAKLPQSEGVRTERWKYLRWMNSQVPIEELYDLQADPGEEENLALSQAHADMLAKLRDRWQALSLLK
jgi:arylsulfatase A-like enzyme